MKRILCIFLFITFLAPVALADDDTWGALDGGNNWDGQKIITNKQYEETVKALEEQKNKKAKKKREKAIKKFKGNSLHENMDPHKDTLESQTPMEEAEECQVISIPVDFINNGQRIERGFYRIECEKDAEGVYISLYQSHKQITKLKARETNDDFGQEYIQFAKLLPYSDTRMKVIFGCLEYNAYAYIDIVD